MGSLAVWFPRDPCHRRRFNSIISHIMKLLRFVLAAAAAALANILFAQASAARTEIANAAQPQLTAGSDGRVWLVYAQATASPSAHVGGDDHKVPPAESKKHKGHQRGGRAGDVFVACSKDGGATFAAPVKVAHVPQLMLGNRRGPRIATVGDRITVTVVALELVAFSSSDGGATWNGPVTINDVPSSAHEGLHDLAGSRDGELFATWLDLRNGKMELWAATSKDAGRTWGKNEQVYKSPDKSICECCHPNAVFDAEGNLAVMWRNSIEGARDMWLMTRARGASRFTPARKLGEGTWKINGCPHDGGTIVALGGGKFGAAWQRAGEVFLIGAEGPEVRLGKGRQPAAVASGNGTIVIWQEGTDLVSVRDSRTEQPTRKAIDGRFPSVVALPGGRGAVVAYEQGAKDTASIAVERL